MMQPLRKKILSVATQHSQADGTPQLLLVRRSIEQKPPYYPSRTPSVRWRVLFNAVKFDLPLYQQEIRLNFSRA